ncbi:MAG: hypothetical protein KF780_06025 [Sphingomonas sp.]|nr:hypothetical protein [Sphingomonas sp.]
MSKVKAFAVVVIIAFTVDMVAYDGLYRERWSRSVQHAAEEVSSLHWTGIVG